VPAELADHPRYHILEPIAAGGVGAVFKARHRLMDRVVALKIIRKDLTLKKKQDLAAHPAEVRALGWAADGKTLAAASGDVVLLWDIPSGKVRATLRGHEGAVLCLAVSEDGSVLATGGADRTIKVWDVAAGAERATLRGHEGAVTAVAFADRGRALLSGSEDKTARRWDVASGRQVGADALFGQPGRADRPVGHRPPPRPQVT
jgi:WD40 repeat protein